MKRYLGYFVTLVAFSAFVAGVGLLLIINAPKMASYSQSYSHVVK